MVFPEVFPVRYLPLLVGILLILAVGSRTKSLASGRPPEVLNIERYASASGKYVLEVDPTDLYGRGPGKYRLLADGQERWSATLPFTLLDAVVTEGGVSIGYAYGEAGLTKAGGFVPGAGDLHVVVIDERGGIRLNQVTRREYGGFIHAPPYPLIKGILLHEELDTFTVRANTGTDETWWLYRLSDGSALKRFPLRALEQHRGSWKFTEAVKPLPGTPLNLLHLNLYDRESKLSGALFRLVDQTGTTVWSHDLPGDYTVPGDEAAEKRLRKLMKERGAILDVGKNGRFQLWFAAESQQVTFQVSRDEAAKVGWRVEEVGRQPYEWPLATDVEPQMEERPLGHLGSFQLETEVPVEPIPGVGGFEFDSEGRIGMVRWEKEGGDCLFVLLDSEGGPVAEVPIPAVLDRERNAQVRVAFIGNEKWVIIATDASGKEQSRAWWFDVEKNALSGSVALDCPDIEAVAATGDGGFVVLGARHLPNTMVDELHAFDAAGRTRWKRGEAGYDGADESLLSPEDLTLTRDREIAVIDNIRKKVQFFDVGGKHLRTVDLEKAWGREPNYPTGIMPDLEGGFIVHDFNGVQRFVRMKADGSVRGPLQPRYQDGRAVDTDRIRIAPDGRLWTTDSHSLLRLNAEGIVDKSLGSLPDEDTLGMIGGVTGDRHGNLYAVDARTGAVHVFDVEGRRLRICKPNPDDFSKRLRSPFITVADDGGVYLRQDSTSGRARYLYFKPDGTRHGFREFQLDGSREEWLCQSGTNNFLVLQYQAALLVNPEGKVLTTIERRSDRRWIDYAADAAVASDGSFAILCGSTHQFGTRTAVALYAKDGAPVRTFPLPDGITILTGYNGRHTVLRTVTRTKEWLTVCDQLGTSVHSFVPPDLGNEWGMFLTREGRELWIVEFRSRTVHRYAMP